MKKQGIVIATFGLLCLICVSVVSLHAYKYCTQRRDMHRMETESYNGIFLSSFSLDNYDESIFLHNRGIPIIIAEYEMKKAKDYAEYFNKVWESGNTITNMYMGIDPYALWVEVDGKQEKWEELIDFYFIRYVEAHPDVIFEILLPYDSLAQWVSRDEAEIAQCLDCYAAFVDRLDDYPNVIQYYLGSQEWLIANPGNYEKGRLEESVARKLMLLCFCDKEYIIVSGNTEILRKELERQIAQEKEEPTVYADLSEYAFVFLGDSIFAYGAGSHSISGVLAGLTGADCYNLAVGGTSAVVTPDWPFSFPYMAEKLIAGVEAEVDPAGNFAMGRNLFLAENAAKKKLVFVLNFGVNDYFKGYPVYGETLDDVTAYTGALRKGISLLKEAYPDAGFILQTPLYTYTYSGGQEVLCQDGNDHVLKDYADAAKMVAAELGIYCLDNFYEFEVDESNHHIYLTDGIHPGEYGRFVLGKRLARFIEQNIVQNQW